MKRFAVVGNPIAHSRSPQLHQSFANECGITLSYEKILSEHFINDLPEFAKAYAGMNVTVPFKFDAFQICDAYGDGFAGMDARSSGAVNTIHFNNEKVLGYNTDGIGLIRDLAHHNVRLTGKTVLIIGAGGAGAGILPALLREQPTDIIIVNRTFSKASALANQYHNKGDTSVSAIPIDSLSDITLSNTVLINTTSAGLTKQTLDLPDSLFEHVQFIYDLSYDLNAPTTFLAETAKYNIPQFDGYGMLIEQARESFHIWHGVLPSRTRMC